MDNAAEKIPARLGRNNPRVVKKPRSKKPSKKPIHYGTRTQRQQLSFSISNTAIALNREVLVLSHVLHR